MEQQFFKNLEKGKYQLKRTLFYSWQSDLNKKTNLNFIESCINNSIKELDSLKPVSIILTLDKATRNVTGSPDITESIFKKISRSNVFIADVSIINNLDKQTRKTPNPNVLIELGYAARTLGWEKIICIYNTDYGNLKDLPFDLRNRRIMPYSFRTCQMSEARKNISTKIEKAIIEMHIKGILTDKILDFLKIEIDREIIGLLTHLIRFINNAKTKDLFGGIEAFLKFSEIDMFNILKEKKVLGFFVLKSFHEYEKKIYNFVNQAMSSQYYNREILNSLIDIYQWFSTYDCIRTRYFSDLLIKLKEKEEEYYPLNGNNPSKECLFPDRYLLLKKINEKEGEVCGFGDFASGHVPDLMYYYKFNDRYLEKYISVIWQLIKFVNKWLEITNNELIMDFIQTFRIKKIDGEWLPPGIIKYILNKNENL